LAQYQDVTAQFRVEDVTAQLTSQIQYIKTQTIKFKLHRNVESV